MSIFDLLQDWINTLSERIDCLEDRVENLEFTVEKKKEKCIKSQLKLKEEAITVSKDEYEKIITLLDKIAFNIKK